MPAKSTARRKPLPILATGAGVMASSAQTAELKRLAAAAYEHDAFSQRLTRSDAARGIDMLKAKLPLLDEPPHTL